MSHETATNPVKGFKGFITSAAISNTGITSVIDSPYLYVLAHPLPIVFTVAPLIVFRWGCQRKNIFSQKILSTEQWQITLLLYVNHFKPADKY